MAGREMRRRGTVNYSRVEQEKGSATPVWLSSKNRRATTAGALNRKQRGKIELQANVSEAELRQTHEDVQVMKPGKRHKSSTQSRGKSNDSPAPARHAARAIAVDEGTLAEKPNIKHSKAVKVVDLKPENVRASGATYALGPAPAAAPSPAGPTAAVAAARAESFQQVSCRKRAAKAVSEDSGQDAHKCRRSVPKSNATQRGMPPRFNKNISNSSSKLIPAFFTFGDPMIDEGLQQSR